MELKQVTKSSERRQRKYDLIGHLSEGHRGTKKVREIESGDREEVPEGKGQHTGCSLFTWLAQAVTNRKMTMCGVGLVGKNCSHVHLFADAFNHSWVPQSLFEYLV